jgi:guanine deaminase
MANNITDKKFMMLALKEALKNVVDCANGGPFGACIVKDGKIIASARNTVLIKDATCHAEINAIRKASKKLGTYDLTGCEIFLRLNRVRCVFRLFIGLGYHV